jgi:Flp pilus assembly protein TadB
MNDMLRAGDRDREEIVEILREHYAQGRLTLEEFDERSTAAYAAKLMGELDPLVADLPVTREAGSATPAWSRTRMRMIAAAGAVAAVAVLVLAFMVGRVFFAVPSWIFLLVVVRLAHRRPGRRIARRRGAELPRAKGPAARDARTRR